MIPTTLTLLIAASAISFPYAVAAAPNDKGKMPLQARDNPKLNEYSSENWFVATTHKKKTLLLTPLPLRTPNPPLTPPPPKRRHAPLPPLPARRAVRGHRLTNEIRVPRQRLRGEQSGSSLP